MNLGIDLLFFHKRQLKKSGEGGGGREGITHLYAYNVSASRARLLKAGIQLTIQSCFKHADNKEKG